MLKNKTIITPNLVELKNNYNYILVHKSNCTYSLNYRNISRVTVKFIKNNLYISSMAQNFLILDMSLGMIKNKPIAFDLKKNSLKYKLVFLRYYFLILSMMYRNYPKNFFQLFVKNSTNLSFWMVDILSSKLNINFIFFINKNNYCNVKRKKFRSIKRKIRKKITLFE